MSTVEAPPSGRRSRRDDILDGALTVFAQRGYAEAGMDEIAREARVAKPTLYNHFADKADLFGAVLARYANSASERVIGVVEDLDVDCDDLRAELERVGHALVACLRSKQGSAVIRLQTTEETRFPELVAGVRDTSRDRTIDHLAGKLARLALAGRLDLPDPHRAARQLLVLVTDDLVLRSANGQRPLADADVDRSVVEGVDTFLAAFAPR